MVKQNSTKAWLLASRPKTLTAASIPVMLGCALAFMYGHFQLIPAILCFLFAFLMQIDANFINDLYDYLKGSDREDRLGPERACAQGWISPSGMKKGILVTTALAAVTGLFLLGYGGWEMIPVGIACIIFAFLYTTGPYPLAYHGWGDILVLVFFGFVPVGCTFYVMAHDWNTSVTMASLACGFVIDTLLMVNNFRDREQDAISGKKTIVVRLGARAGLILYFLLGLAACWSCFYFVTEGRLWAAILPQIYLLFHIPEMQEVLAHVMNIEPEDVSIKATTTEKLGFTGREEGISAYATVLIERD
jgi:1,4-dihydroxy-2-naphthoate polyprenyltransferase